MGLRIQQTINRLLECFERLGADNGFAVNNEAGCALNANLAGNIGLR